MRTLKELSIAACISVSLLWGAFLATMPFCLGGDKFVRPVDSDTSAAVRALQDKGAYFVQDENGDITATLQRAVSVPGPTSWTGSDDDLRMLADVPRLVEVDLNIRVTKPTALDFLPRMRTLKHLDMDAGSVSDIAMKYVAKCTTLERLSGICGITNVGMRNVMTMKNLRALDWVCPNVGDDGLDGIESLAELRELQLCDSSISIKTLRKIANLKKLRELVLNSTPVGDESIPILIKMSQLKLLYVRGTEVTIAGLTELRRQLPGCSVYGDDSETAGKNGTCAITSK